MKSLGRTFLCSLGWHYHTLKHMQVIIVAIKVEIIKTVMGEKVSRDSMLFLGVFERAFLRISPVI